MTVPSDIQVIRDLQKRAAAGDAKAQTDLLKFKRLWAKQRPDVPFPAAQK